MFTFQVPPPYESSPERAPVPLVAILLASWYAVGPGIMLYYDVSPKAIVLLAGLGSVLVFSRRLPDGRHLLGSEAGRFFTGVVTLEALLLAASTAVSVAPALSLAGSSWRRTGAFEELALLGLLWLAAAQVAADRRRATVWLRWLSCGAIPLALYALLQYAGIDPLLPRGSSINHGTLRPPATLGNALYLANVLTPAAIAAVGLSRMAATRRSRVLWALAGLVLGAGMVATGTRSAFLGLAAAAAVATVINGARQRRAAIAVLLLVVALPAGLLIAPPGGALGARIAQWKQDWKGGTRPMVWEQSLRLATRYWPLGSGPETFALVFPGYSSPALANAFPDTIHEAPHNVLLDLAVNRGAPALLAWLAMVAIACTGGVMRAPPGDPRRVIVPMLAAEVVMECFGVFTISEAPLFYLVLGMAAGCRFSGEHANAPIAATPRWLRICAAAVGLAAIGYALQLGWAEFEMAQARDAFVRNDVAAAMRAFGLLQRWRLPGACYDLWFAKNLMEHLDVVADPVLHAEGETVLINAAERAVGCTEERGNALLLLSLVYGRSARSADIERTLRRAVSEAPYWYMPRVVLAHLLAGQNRFAEADREAQIALSVAGARRPDVDAAYQRFRAARKLP